MTPRRLRLRFDVYGTAIRRIVGAVLLIVFPGMVGGQDKSPIPPRERLAENAVSARLQSASKLLADGKWLDSLETLERVLDSSAGELVPVGHGRFVQARWEAHRLIANLPKEGLAAYRNRVDVVSERRLAAARLAVDDGRLERLLADRFCSTSGEAVILELARRAFLNADFDSAEHYWSMLLPVDGASLRYPQPKTATTLTQARLILVQLYRGERTTAEQAVRELERLDPKATGRIIGSEETNLVSELKRIAGDPSATTLRPDRRPRGWTTLGGQADRSGTIRESLPYFWPIEPTWTADVPDPPKPGSAIYPIFADGRIYFSNGRTVYEIGPRNGEIGLVGHGGSEMKAQPAVTTGKASTVVTAWQRMLIVRTGATDYAPGDGIAAESRGEITAYGPRPSNSPRRDVAWRLKPPAAAESMTVWEGTPVVAHDRLVVGYLRLSGRDVVPGLCCYRLFDDATGPRLEWDRTLGRATLDAETLSRRRNGLVSVSGTTVYFATECGAITAIDLVDGRSIWEHRYRSRVSPESGPRPVGTCLVDGGRVYAAPADSDRLWCFDRRTGRVIWERDSLTVLHLMGCANGRLIATIGGAVRGLRGFDLRTGSDESPLGWIIHSDGGESTRGRGLVADGVVVWPGRSGTHFLDPRDGTILRSPLRGVGGNMAFSCGTVVVAESDRIRGFVSEGARLSDLRRRADRRPDVSAYHSAVVRSALEAGSPNDVVGRIAMCGPESAGLAWETAEHYRSRGDVETADRILKGVEAEPGLYGEAIRRRLVRSKPATIRNHPPVLLFDRRGQLELPAVEIPLPRFPTTDGPVRGSAVSSVFPQTTTKELQVPETLPDGTAGHRAELWTRIECGALTLLHDDRELLVCRDGGRTAIEQWAVGGPVLNGDMVVRIGNPVPGDSGRRIRRVIPSEDGTAFAVIVSPGLILVRDGSSNGPTLRTISLREVDPRASIDDDWVERALLTRNPEGPGMPAPLLLFGQTTRGVTAAIDVGSGRVLFRRVGPKTSWLSDPVRIGTNGIAWTEGFKVVRYDRDRRAVTHERTLPQSTSATGSNPTLRVGRSCVYAVIEHNVGREVIRLDPVSLTPQWTDPPLVMGRTVSDIIDRGADLWVLVDGRLYAYRSTDGRRTAVAAVSLPDTHTQLALLDGDRVVAYPQQPVSRRAPRLFRNGLSAPRMVEWVGVAYDAWMSCHWEFLVIEIPSGELQYRIPVPADPASTAESVVVRDGRIDVRTGRSQWTITIPKP